MIKRTITETIYEYDKQGNLLKKTVTETHEEEENTTLTYPSNPITQPYITWCNGTETIATDVNTASTATITN